MKVSEYTAKFMVFEHLLMFFESIAYGIKVPEELDRKYKDSGIGYAEEFLGFLSMEMPFCAERLHLSPEQQEVIYALLKFDELQGDIKGYRRRGVNLLSIFCEAETYPKQNQEDLGERVNAMGNYAGYLSDVYFGLTVDAGSWLRGRGYIAGWWNEPTDIVFFELFPSMPSSDEELAELYRLSGKEKKRRNVRVYYDKSGFCLEKEVKADGRTAVNRSSSYLFLGSFFSESLDRESYVYGHNSRNTTTKILTPERARSFDYSPVPAH